jgi:hypothetical protein
MPALGVGTMQKPLARKFFREAASRRRTAGHSCALRASSNLLISERYASLVAL